MIDTDGVDRAAQRGQMVAYGVEIDCLQIFARRPADQHRLRIFAARVKALLLKFIVVVEAAEHLADAAAKMAGHQRERREFIEHAIKNDARERGATVERAPDAGRQAKLAHALFTEAYRRRMQEHRHTECTDKLEERPRLRVIRIGALMARIDQHAFEPVALDCALQLLQMTVAAARYRARKS